ncbi:MAG: pyridine nucleotide-disulfide oxidoreductase, partial [Corynebacterium casei]|nr:pyridine nucleotide-disulfide oxidoreductase [Corynebacterium casei]
MATTTNQAETTADVLAIGFGKAGKTIAMNRAEHGDRVILVEQSPKMYGGTCINIACVPTKTMLVDSERGVNYEGSVQHRDSFIATLNKVNKELADDSGVLVVDGHAEFTGSHSVLVTGGEEEL